MVPAPLVVAEIGINHDGVMERAFRMVQDAAAAGCKCVKFQTHILEDEYIPAAKQIIPANATESIWDIMERCALSEPQERSLKEYTESLGMMYLSTPFSRASADRLERMNVSMFKIGSGECNNYPLIKHIAAFGKPIILSTGMNSWPEIDKAIEIIGDQLYCILHCVSMYPTPYNCVNLGRMQELRRYGKPVGLSDHSIGIYTALAGVALGAAVVEKHFVSDKSWPGPDVSISIGPNELSSLIQGVSAIHEAMGGAVQSSAEQSRTAEFAFASVVAIHDIHANETFTLDNVWVKRPGTGIAPKHFEQILGHQAACNIPIDTQINWGQVIYP